MPAPVPPRASRLFALAALACLAACSDPPALSSLEKIKVGFLVGALDDDGDGCISRDEARRLPPEARAGLRRWFDFVDADDDGLVTSDELAALVAAARTLGIGDDEMQLTDKAGVEAMSGFDLSRGSMSLTATATSRTSTGDEAKDYAERGVDLAFTFPLYSAGGIASGMWNIYGLLSAGYSRPVTEVLDRDVHLLRAAAGVAATWLTRGLELFGLAGAVAFAEEESSLEHARPLPLVVGFGAHPFSRDFVLLYGAGFTWAFGRGLPLAFVGFTWCFSPGWNLQAVLPVLLRTRYRASSSWDLGLVLGVHGSQFSLVNDGLLPGEGQRLRFGVTGARLGFEARYQASPDLRLDLEIGLRAPQWMQFTQGFDTLDRRRLEPSACLTLGLRYGFGREEQTDEAVISR